MQPRKCGARVALQPPELARTPLPAYSLTEPPLEAHTAALSRDAISSSQHTESVQEQGLPFYSFSS